MVGEVRNYEMLYILRPDLDEAARGNKIAKVGEMIESQGGQVKSTEEWGLRILAYEIDHFREGYYVLVTFSLPNDQVRSLEDRFRMDDEILRYQIVRVDGR